MMIQAWHWLVFGVILIILEMFVPSFFLLWFGAAAVVVALLAWLLPLGLAVAVVVWLALSVVLCALWFKFIQPTMKNRTKAGLGGASVIGEMGMIIKATDAKSGMIRFNVPILGASEWVCRSQDGMPLAVGERAVVVQILGNELLVAKHGKSH